LRVTGNAASAARLVMLAASTPFKIRANAALLRKSFAGLLFAIALFTLANTWI
jgi:hypothetical protein